jgi:hypothetical protein
VMNLATSLDMAGSDSHYQDKIYDYTSLTRSAERERERERARERERERPGSSLPSESTIRSFSPASAWAPRLGHFVGPPSTQSVSSWKRGK